MKAYIIKEKSQRTLEDLTIADMPLPTIADDEVLIETRAVGLNPVDYKVIENGVAAWTFPHIIGMDVAGIVVKVGAKVTHLKIGDRVAGHGNLAKQGCLAEYAAKAYYLAKIPPKISFVEAAGLLCGAMTAYQAIFRKVSLQNKKTILIHAGAGGVGSIAIQLAKLAGLKVYTTISTPKIPFVEKLQPNAIIDYQKNSVSQAIRQLTNGLGVDLIINTVGADEATKDLERLAYNGQLVAIVAAPHIEKPDFLFDNGLGIHLLNLGGAHRSQNDRQKNDLAVMAQDLLDLAAKGKLDPLISHVYNFEETPRALQAIKNHDIVGKCVVRL